MPSVVETPSANSPATALEAPRRNAASGLIPQTWDQVFRVANVFAASSLVPKNFQGKPEDCIVAIAFGAELGLAPLQAMNTIAVIGGRPAVFGDGSLGIIQSSPSYERHSEYFVSGVSGETVTALSAPDLANDATRAVAKFWRRGSADPFVGEFSIGDAKRARLWNKPGPWQEYPSRMLRWRARGFAGRDGFAAELRGIAIGEEITDAEHPGASAVPDAPVVLPVRRSAKSAATAPAVSEAPANAVPDEGPREYFRDGPAMPRAAEPDTVQPGETYQLTPPTEPVPPLTAEELFRTPLPPLPPPARRGPGRPPKAPPAAATGGDAPSVVIVDTLFVPPRDPKDGDPFYEINTRVAIPGQAPLALNFVTRDKSIYDLAASAEGTDHTFAVTWINGRLPNGSPCKILETIGASEA